MVTRIIFPGQAQSVISISKEWPGHRKSAGQALDSEASLPQIGWWARNAETEGKWRLKPPLEAFLLLPGSNLQHVRTQYFFRALQKELNLL